MIHSTKLNSEKWKQSEEQLEDHKFIHHVHVQATKGKTEKLLAFQRDQLKPLLIRHWHENERNYIYPKAQTRNSFQRRQAQQGSSNSLEGSKQVGDMDYCKIASLLKGLTDVCFYISKGKHWFPCFPTLNSTTLIIWLISWNCNRKETLMIRCDD